MRELQASPFQQQHPYQAGIAINELPVADQNPAAALSTNAAAHQGAPGAGDDKPLGGMCVLLVEDTMHGAADHPEEDADHSRRS
jgi:hypothetical protein